MPLGKFYSRRHNSSTKFVMILLPLFLENWQWGIFIKHSVCEKSYRHRISRRVYEPDRPTDKPEFPCGDQRWQVRPPWPDSLQNHWCAQTSSRWAVCSLARQRFGDWHTEWGQGHCKPCLGVGVKTIMFYRAQTLFNFSPSLAYCTVAKMLEWKVPWFTRCNPILLLAFSWILHGRPM